MASRLGVFPVLPPGNKYELVLEGAEHSAFGDRPLPGDKEPRNPNHHRAILALSTAFWDAYLRGDAAAKAWLDGAGPRTVLESNAKRADENIALEDLRRATKVVARTLFDLLG